LIGPCDKKKKKKDFEIPAYPHIWLECPFVYIYMNKLLEMKK